MQEQHRSRMAEERMRGEAAHGQEALALSCAEDLLWVGGMRVSVLKLERRHPAPRGPHVPKLDLAPNPKPGALIPNNPKAIGNSKGAAKDGS